MLRVIRVLLLMAVAAFLLAAAAVFYLVQEFDAPGPAAADVVVIIPPGLGVAAIGERLGEAGVVHDPFVFTLGARYFGRDRALQAGEFLFPARVSARAAMEILIEGKTVVHKLTVPEGLTAAEILQRISAAEALAGELPAETPAEGMLLPDTYNFSRGDTRAGMVARMQAEMQTALDALWPARIPDLPLASVQDALILASIVEKETGVAAERPRVAAVFVNRLRKGMPLQSDPTVIYALTEGRGPLDRALTKADLDYPSPYNTYLHSGLPPGPIANPGRASLTAVLNPAATKDLYFVADGTGGHAFAETLEEHNRNVAKWRALDSQQGEGAEGGGSQ